MDSLIAASARALAAGDALGALKRVALRSDPPALALRGIAMAQLGEHGRARMLLRQAARAFGPREALARARCTVAEAEVALALRELATSPAAMAALAGAVATLDAHGDLHNAVHARLIMARRWLLAGRLADAVAALAELPAPFEGAHPPPLAAVAAMVAAEIALRRLDLPGATAALARAAAAARQAGVPALHAEVTDAQAVLAQPAARLVGPGGERLLRLDEVAALRASDTLVVDACQRGLRAGTAWLPLARRPILFALLEALGQAWPAGVARNALIASAFRTRRPDDTHRARLRVEIGRLRALAKPFAAIEATAEGFALAPINGRAVVLLAPPVQGDAGALLALLSDGAAWSTSALAVALGTGQRSVQRALAALEAAGRVRATGQARARRWLAPSLSGFATILLLPAAMPNA